MDIFSLQWLVGDRIESSQYDEDSGSWLLSFKSGASLNIECIWRLIEEGYICSTSADHGQYFGRDKPFNGVAALNEMGEHEIVSINVNPNVGDVLIGLGELFVLQVLPTSAGYESWQAKNSAGESVVAEGGQLHAF